MTPTLPRLRVSPYLHLRASGDQVPANNAWSSRFHGPPVRVTENLRIAQHVQKDAMHIHTPMRVPMPTMSMSLMRVIMRLPYSPMAFVRMIMPMPMLMSMTRLCRRGILGQLAILIMIVFMRVRVRLAITIAIRNDRRGGTFRLVLDSVLCRLGIRHRSGLIAGRCLTGLSRSRSAQRRQRPLGTALTRSGSRSAADTARTSMVVVRRGRHWPVESRSGPFIRRRPAEAVFVCSLNHLRASLSGVLVQGRHGVCALTVV